MSRDDTDVLLPAYRPRSYNPEHSETAFKDRPVTPAVVAAAQGFATYTGSLDADADWLRYQNGEVLGGISTGDIAVNCGLTRRYVRYVLLGRYRSRSARMVICAYLQISLEQLDEIIERRKKAQVNWLAVREYRRVFGLIDKSRARSRGRTNQYRKRW